MKIGDVRSRARDLSGSRGVESLRDSQESQGKSFQDTLSQNRHDLLEEELRMLMEGIDDQGKRLGRRVDVKELLRYKQMVAEFLNKATGEFLKYRREGHADRRGRHRLYSTVVKVNEKLEQLTKEVLNQEQDNLSVLGCIDDIRGMLLDLTL